MSQLTAEQKADLRQKVLLGHVLSLEEARDVIESSRNGAAIAVLAGETKKRKGKTVALSDEALEKDLDSLGL